MVTKENSRSCVDWDPLDESQRNIRIALWDLQGEGALRILHQLPKYTKPKQATEIDSVPTGTEDVDEMMIPEMPDFTDLLYEGITSVEREEQLRYETDEEGNTVLEDFHGQIRKRLRPTYQLRKFACDPELHVGLSQQTALFWTQDKLVRHILKVEVDLGLLVKTKRTRTPKSAPEEEAAKPKEKKMATAVKRKKVGGRKVLTKKKAPARKVGPKPSGTKTSKVAKPPAKTAAKKKTTRTRKSEPEGLPAVPNIDIDALKEEVQVAAGEAVSRALEPIMERLKAIEENQVKLMEGITIFHDLMVQTEGTMHYENDEGEMVPLELMLAHDDKILGQLGDEDEGGEDEEEYEEEEEE
jgi:hypothetical protein